MEKKKVVFLCTAVALTVCVVSCLFTSVYLKSSAKTSEVRLESEDYAGISELMDIMDLKNIIQETYYRDVDDETLLNGALKGMVEALNDPYSVYYPEDEYNEYTQKNDGTFVGVGITVQKDSETGYLRVIDLDSEGPAEQAGVQVGDVIIQVDGADIAAMQYDEVQDALKGPVGSAVSLTLQNSDGEQRTLSIVRAEVKNRYVFYTMYDDIAYTVISEFHGDVSADFEKALQYARDEGACGMVIDLRNNLGGSVKECTEIADMILPEGMIVYMEDKQGERTEYLADKDYDDIPIVLLVNGATASASEILAGAVQDRQRGSVIGTQTYGKGIVQSVKDMPYSGGGVKLTSSVYYTPNGRSINEVGITPDIEVQLPEEVLSGEQKLNAQTDTQLIRAMEELHKLSAADTAE